MAATLGNGTITFGDGTSQSTAGSMLGIGQTWQDIGAWSYNTTYTNSTGKPIMLGPISYNYTINSSNYGYAFNYFISDTLISVNSYSNTYSFQGSYSIKDFNMSGLIVPINGTWRVNATFTGGNTATPTGFLHLK
jgi:hypothetical protein